MTLFHEGAFYNKNFVRGIYHTPHTTLRHTPLTIHHTHLPQHHTPHPPPHTTHTSPHSPSHPPHPTLHPSPNTTHPAPIATHTSPPTLHHSPHHTPLTPQQHTHLPPVAQLQISACVIKIRESQSQNVTESGRSLGEAYASPRDCFKLLGRSICFFQGITVGWLYC